MNKQIEIVEKQDLPTVTVGKDVTPINLSVTNKGLAEMKEKYTGLTASTPKEFTVLKAAIADTRNIRTAVKEKKEELKRPYLDANKAIDKEYNRVYGILEEIEKPLKVQKDKYEAEQKRKKEEKERIEKKRIQDIQDKIKNLYTFANSLHGKRPEEIEQSLAFFNDCMANDTFNYMEFEPSKIKAVKEVKESFATALHKAKEEEKKRLEIEVEAKRIQEEKKKLEAERAEIARQKKELEEKAVAQQNQAAAKLPSAEDVKGVLKGYEHENAVAEDVKGVLKGYEHENAVIDACITLEDPGHAVDKSQTLNFIADNFENRLSAKSEIDQCKEPITVYRKGPEYSKAYPGCESVKSIQPEKEGSKFDYVQIRAKDYYDLLTLIDSFEELTVKHRGQFAKWYNNCEEGRKKTTLYIDSVNGDNANSGDSPENAKCSL